MSAPLSTHGSHRIHRSPGLAGVPVVLAGLTIAAQILWPLASGEQRAVVTVLVVWLFFATSAGHALITRGPRWTAVWCGVSLAFGLGIEVLGTGTGFPFGSYGYDLEALGWSVAGVPVVVPLAWAMMSYPAILVGRRIGRSTATVVIASAWALASWDLFLDPQMVGEAYWTWQSPQPTMPGIPGIPLTNYIGWLAGSLLLMGVLHRLLPSAGATEDSGSLRDEAVPAVLYLWTWIGGIVANLFFLQRPWVALIGGVAMGVTAVPYALALRRQG